MCRRKMAHLPALTLVVWLGAAPPAYAGSQLGEGALQRGATGDTTMVFPSGSVFVTLSPTQAGVVDLAGQALTVVSAVRGAEFEVEFQVPDGRLLQRIGGGALELNGSFTLLDVAGQAIWTIPRGGGQARIEDLPSLGDMGFARLTGSWEGALALQSSDRVLAAPIGGMAQDTVILWEISPPFSSGLPREIVRLGSGMSSRFVVQGEIGVRSPPYTMPALTGIFGECVMIVEPGRHELSIIDRSSKQRRSIDLPFERNRILDSDRARWVTGMVEAIGDEEATWIVQSIADRIWWPEFMPAVNALFVDGQGDIWLEEFHAPLGPSGRWSVVGTSGEMKAQVALPPGLILLAADQAFLLAGRWDESGAAILDRFFVERTHDGQSRPSSVSDHC